MDERSFFDNIAEKWDDNEILSTPDKVNHILDFFDLHESDNVLDLGTGTGVLLPFIADRIGKEGKLTAVDFSMGMLKRAIEKYSNLSPIPEFLNLDFENETIPGEYDKIVLYCVYPHLHSPIETLKWLAKVNLKDNGQIYIAFPCGPDFINNIHKERHSDSDALVRAHKLVAYLRENNLNATVLADDNNSYVIKIIK